jgi:hypothetical protein
VNVYVAWQWWDDLFFDYGREKRSGWWATGTRVPLLRTFVIHRAAQLVEERTRSASPGDAGSREPALLYE